MIGAALTGLGLLLKVCGLITWAEKMFELAQATRRGEERQAQKSTEAQDKILRKELDELVNKPTVEQTEDKLRKGEF